MYTDPNFSLASCYSKHAPKSKTKLDRMEALGEQKPGPRPLVYISHITCNLKQVIACSRMCGLNSLDTTFTVWSKAVVKVIKIPLKCLDSGSRIATRM